MEAGFKVLCEKPMMMSVQEGEEVARIAKASGKILVVNDCYVAYPMVRRVGAMVRAGDIGKISPVVSDFSHDHPGYAADADFTPARSQWHQDP